MDCEKFESAMMDELYGDLDELTSAAAKRHVAGCARCAALFGGLRATRRVATLPWLEVPAGLEERVLAAAREAQKVVPMRRRAAYVLSVAGSWAMRPQTAMAALFLVMIGSSVLLLRGRSARAPAASSEVTVIEQGAPAPVAAPVAAATPTSSPTTATNAAAPSLPRHALEAKPPPAAMASGAAWADDDARRAVAKEKAAEPRAETTPLTGIGGATGAAANVPMSREPASLSQAATPQGAQGAASAEGLSFDGALQSYRGGRYDDAARAFDSLAPGDANADLWAARAVREGKGCRNALARFDRVARRAAGTAPGWDALLEGALCYRNIGDFDNARVRLKELLKVDSHRDRAQAELDRINQVAQTSGGAGPAAGAAKPMAAPRAQAQERPAAAPTAFDSMRK
jgi:hypothetical protein